MKRTVGFLLASISILVLLVGCETMKITIAAEPEDSKIYVNGEYIGNDTVTYDIGRKYGNSRELVVSIQHPDYKTLNTLIETKFDVGYAAGLGALSLGSAGVFAIQGITANSLAGQEIDDIGALLLVLICGGGIAASDKYEKAYYFTLTRND
jgi:hypothetical protein